MSRRGSSAIKALTQSKWECARSKPFINGGWQNSDLQYQRSYSWQDGHRSLWITLEVALTILPDHEQTEINPAGAESGFLVFRADGWG